MRVIIDTNVLMSSILIRKSVASKVFDHVIKNHQLLRSEATLLELSTTIIRPKFDKYVSQTFRISFIQLFIEESIEVKIKGSVSRSRDPKDNMFLELSKFGKANYLITGDKDLLTLNSQGNTIILTPNSFLNSIAKGF